MSLRFILDILVKFNMSVLDKIVCPKNVLESGGGGTNYSAAMKLFLNLMDFKYEYVGA